MTTRPGETPLDPLLSAALRHAPDHDAQPAAELDARILREAHAALNAQTTGPARPARSHWLRLLDRLTLPSLAGALGTVVMATVIGLMWRDGPPPEPAAKPRAEREVAARDDATGTPTSTEPSKPTVADTPALGQAEAPAPAAPAVVARQRADAPARAKSEVDQRAIGRAAPAVVAESATRELAEPRAEPAPESGPTATAGAAPASPMPAAKSMPAAAAEARNAALPAPDPLAAPLAALAGAESDSPAATALQRLTGLRTTLAGRWRESSPLAAGEGEPVLDRAGQLLGRLRIDDGQVTWQATGAPTSWTAAR